jgi:hypothetical protein
VVRIELMQIQTRPAASRLALAAAAAVSCALALALPSSAGAAIASEGAPRVLIVFLPGQLKEPPALGAVGSAPKRRVERTVTEQLAAQSQLSVGLSSPVQGRYIAAQALLDITQGTRVSLSSYSPEIPPSMLLVPDQRGAYFRGWMAVEKRARDAPAQIVPGLLAGSIGGGAAYAGVEGQPQKDAVVAADRAGRIERLSIGPAATLPARAQALLRDRRLVVATLAAGGAGDRQLSTLLAERDSNELLIVMRSPPDKRGAQLLPVGIAGLGKPGTLTSSTTHLDGVVAGIDILPTAFDWLGVPIPSAASGQPIQVLPGRDAQQLLALKGRLQVVGQHRFPVLWALLGGWIILTLAAMLAADRRGMRWAMRCGALAVFWLPSILLLTAALAPSMVVEMLLVVFGSLLLGIASDYVVPWPRAPALPAFVAVGAYIVDLAFGSPLIIRSLLGPNPLFGSRFYGIGNELESTLPALLLIGLGALLFGRGRSRGAAALFAGCGLVLGVALGAAQLGADVGGVMTVAAGFGVAVLLMLPGRLSGRMIALVAIAPFAALALLAAIDLLSGGDSHFTRTVLRADGSGAWWEIFVRRIELAGRGLIRGLMPVATLIALLTVVLGIVRRNRLLAPVDGDSGWRAGLAGAAAVGVFGAIFNDSGPMLLLFAVFVAICGATYLRGDPLLADSRAR